MQQRIRFRHPGEIARLAPQRQVRHERGARRDVAAQPGIVAGQLDHGPQGHGGQQDHDQGGEEPADAAGIEVRQAERPLAQAAGQDPGDQVAGDHEKEIDPGEAARQGGGKGVVDQHAQDGQGTQAVDIRAIGKRRGMHDRKQVVM